MIAADGKTLRGSKTCPTGKGRCIWFQLTPPRRGSVLAQQAVDGKSNEFTAIPELLDMLNLKGAIVSIDAMGTRDGDRPAHRRQRRGLRARAQRQSDQPA